jgi:hypothetical protein
MQHLELQEVSVDNGRNQLAVTISDCCRSYSRYTANFNLTVLLFTEYSGLTND